MITKEVTFIKLRKFKNLDEKSGYFYAINDLKDFLTVLEKKAMGLK
jgi:hypothetical protein